MSQGLLLFLGVGGRSDFVSSSQENLRRFLHDSQGVVSTTRRAQYSHRLFPYLKLDSLAAESEAVVTRGVRRVNGRERSVKCVCNIILSDWETSLSRFSWTFTYPLLLFFCFFCVCDKLLFCSTVLYILSSSFWRVLQREVILPSCSFNCVPVCASYNITPSAITLHCCNTRKENSSKKIKYFVVFPNTFPPTLLLVFFLPRGAFFSLLFLNLPTPHSPSRFSLPPLLFPLACTTHTSCTVRTPPF